MTLILYDLCGRNPDLRFSPYCWRAKMALAHKALRFEAVATPFVAIAGVENGASKTVPVINDGGRVIADSFEIALYLERTYPDAPALFGSPSAVASAHFLQAWAFGALHSVIVRMILNAIHGTLGEADQTYFRTSREARFKTSLEDYQSGIEANRRPLPPRSSPSGGPWGITGGSPGRIRPLPTTSCSER